jgi:hypothetical protein
MHGGFLKEQIAVKPDDQRLSPGTVMNFSVESKAPPAEARTAARPTMLAFGIERFGPPSVLGPRVVERPAPRAGQMLVKVAAKRRPGKIVLTVSSS